MVFKISYLTHWLLIWKSWNWGMGCWMNIKHRGDKNWKFPKFRDGLLHRYGLFHGHVLQYGIKHWKLIIKKPDSRMAFLEKLIVWHNISARGVSPDHLQLLISISVSRAVCCLTHYGAYSVYLCRQNYILAHVTPGYQSWLILHVYWSQYIPIVHTGLKNIMSINIGYFFIVQDHSPCSPFAITHTDWLIYSIITTEHGTRVAKLISKGTQSNCE